MATRVSLDISTPVTIYLGSPIVWARMIRWSTRSLIVLDNIRLSIVPRTTVCMLAGHSYNIPIGGTKSEYAVWTYETPYEAVASIRDYLAFYPTRVDAIEVAS